LKHHVKKIEKHHHPLHKSTTKRAAYKSPRELPSEFQKSCSIIDSTSRNNNLRKMQKSGNSMRLSDKGLENLFEHFKNNTNEIGKRNYGNNLYSSQEFITESGKTSLNFRN
jgi:hypothetical protein